MDEIAPAIDLALARSTVCRGLKLGLQYPTPEILHSVLSSDSKRAMLRAAQRLGKGKKGPLYETIEALCELDPWKERGLAERYESLLGHTLRGRVCPYETEYGSGQVFRQAHELADLSGYYLAFGLRPSAAGGERPDHIACELEFMEFLYQKEAYALDRGDGEMHEVTLEATRKFLRGHLGRFGRAFGVQLTGEDDGGFYGRLGAVLVAFLTLECSRYDVPPGPEVMKLRTVGEDQTPMACGSAGSLIPIEIREEDRS